MRYFYLLSTLLLFTACQEYEPRISHSIQEGCAYYSLQRAQCRDMTDVLKELEPYPVIFIGDHHSEDELHKKIATLLNAVAKDGYKLILGNEWFYPEDNKLLKEYAHTSLSSEAFSKKIQWKQRLKWYKFESFQPIYEAVKENHGELYGINLSKERRKKISDQNLSGMSEEERTFYDSLNLNVQPHQELVMPFLSHCHMKKKGESEQECAKRMYRVQVAWDSKMALESYKLAKDLKNDEKLVVFAGSMHMENNLGIPLRFARLYNIPTFTIIPISEKSKKANHGIGDLLMLYKQNPKNK